MDIKANQVPEKASVKTCTQLKYNSPRQSLFCVIRIKSIFWYFLTGRKSEACTNHERSHKLSLRTYGGLDVGLVYFSFQICTVSYLNNY
jgi:hypothetical protein